MNTLKGFKDFHKVIRPLIMKQNHYHPIAA